MPRLRTLESFRNAIYERDSAPSLESLRKAALGGRLPGAVKDPVTARWMVDMEIYEGQGLQGAAWNTNPILREMLG